ncbi:hypothetical protein AtubIFM56815_011299 [Aspergillus tubingensis]|uniref:Apple domain-containing protein n=2 Tax=Aspergillus subgen. Circumdati TaxID=2720871 RepID=A0A124BYH1_ASPNG|nr:hypothetical protein ABL_08132 [Aspergillus niger]GLA57671.1 hypothetical protein AtubIFM54640_005463 [Aspergillus tubingensis]GLA87028.1 hypothetical protein AtubIFM56815_011299 [Aspergillus tubingensis]
MSPKTSIITTYLLALLASLISAQTVREHLDRFCPSQNGQEVQLEERLFVTYHCGKAPEDWDLLESYPAAMDPEACSRACVASSPCKGSLYSAQPANRRAPCFLYLGATEPVLEDMDRVLWMSYRKVSPFWTRLIREMEQLKKDLEACQASCGGEEGDGGDNGGGEEGGENGGNDGGSGTGPNDAVCWQTYTSIRSSK